MHSHKNRLFAFWEILGWQASEADGEAAAPEGTKRKKEREREGTGETRERIIHNTQSQLIRVRGNIWICLDLLFCCCVSFFEISFWGRMEMFLCIFQDVDIWKNQHV